MKKTPTDLDEGTIRRIDWQELFPAVLLPQSFSLAVSFRVLWLSILGTLLTLLLGFLLNGISEQLLWNKSRATTEEHTAMNSLRTVRAIEKDHIDVDHISEMTRVKIAKQDSFDSDSLRFPTMRDSFEAVAYPWTLLTNSVTRMLPLRETARENFFSVLWFIGMLSIWTLFGGMITRTAAMRITIGQHERMGKLHEFMNWRWRSYFAAVFLPMIGMGLCAFALWIAGKLASMTVLNYFVAIAFPLVLLAAFCVAILGIGLLFGWPLAFAAISVDGSDGFDAVSRSYSYIFQRPLQLIFYVLLALVIGSLGWYFVAWFVDLTLAVLSAVSGITPVDFSSLGTAETLRALREPDPESVTKTPLPQTILSFWCWCFQMAKVGFLFGYFWTSTTVIYVILRRSVDGTAIDEVRFHPSVPVTKTPAPIKKDEKGAPEMQKTE